MRLRFAELGRLLDCVRHLAGLAMAEADAPLLIANDDQRGKPEAAAALHHLGDAVDVDEFVHEFAVALFAIAVSASITWITSHEPILSFFSSPSLSQRSKQSSKNWPSPFWEKTLR